MILLLNGSIASTFALVSVIFAAAFLGASTTGWCPLYKPMNIDTKKPARKQDS